MLRLLSELGLQEEYGIAKEDPEDIRRSGIFADGCSTSELAAMEKDKKFTLDEK